MQSAGSLTRDEAPGDRASLTQFLVSDLHWHMSSQTRRLASLPRACHAGYERGLQILDEFKLASYTHLIP